MEGKCSSWSIPKGFPKYARPMRANLILGIPKINEAKRPGSVACGSEVVILSPINAIADPIGIERIGLQICKGHAMVIRLIDIALKKFRLGLENFRF
jgi:hypothetical protein